MLLLLLAACGYPSYYPNPGYTGSADTWAPDPTMPCGSYWSSDPVELRLVDNTGGSDLALFEVGSDCSETVRGPISSTEVTSVNTFPGAVFAARTRDGALYAWTQIPSGEAVWPWSIE